MLIGIDIRNIGKKRTGDETVFFNLAKSLAKLDSQNEYRLFTDIRTEETLTQIKKSLGIDGKNNFSLVSLRSSGKFCWNFWVLGAYLRKNPVDIYLTQYITPLFVPKKIKIVTIIHDISFNFYPQFIRWTDRIFLKYLIPVSLRRAAKVIGVSRFTRREIIDFYNIDERKVEFVYNASSENFKEEIGQDEINIAKEKYHLPQKYILYVGTLQPRKNLSSLVEAFALLRDDKKQGGEDLRLVLAGGKGHNYDRRIDEAIQRNGLVEDVIMPGYIEEGDLAPVIKGAEVFCFPSLYEGFGIPILDALNLGVPVAASDIEPHREIAGDAALFFQPEIPGVMAEKIREILRNKTLALNLVSEGKERAKKFVWEDSARKLLDIFYRLKV